LGVQVRHRRQAAVTNQRDGRGEAR
jgi:hypothetical protein